MMPKKFKGTNSKAAEAKQRKEDRRVEEQAKKEKELEDKYWEDDDKHANRKLQRKEDRERKRQDQQSRKKELSEIAESELGATSAKQQPQAKLTVAQVEANAEARRAKETAAAAKSQGKKGGAVVVLDDEEPIEENVNRLVSDADEARTVEDAIKVLSVGGDNVDLHPEKRMRAAYATFEAARMPILKTERPNMRLSQLKQIIRKEWMKSPENPINKNIEGR